jgi:mono/diheme cytochrome c family protein
MSVRSFKGLFICLSLTAACASTEELVETRSQTTLSDRIAACSADPRVVAGLVSVDVCVGADLFFREQFAGNGRSCATCHRVDNNFTIDVSFISKLPPTDPLFVAELDPALAGLELPAQMRGRGLILENVDGFAPDPTVNFVLRSVPHNLSMGTSVTRAPGDPVAKPADRTGWSGDGAPGAGTLRDFQTGAIMQHYTRSLDRIEGEDFRLAVDGELDSIEQFMRQLGRTNELDLATVVMADARAEAGRQAFLSVGCNGCHGNAGANATFGGGGNRNFNTGVEDARNAALAGFPRDGGFLQAPNAAGGFGDGTFNTPPLVEAADTGPFFHTDTTISGADAHNTPTATTIEEAIAFYDTPTFRASPVGQVLPIDLTATQIDDIGRFLRGVNAAFNAQLALKRLDAARALVLRFASKHLALQRELLRLANVEVNDAIKDLLGQAQLNDDSRQALLHARDLIDAAQLTTSPAIRLAAIVTASDAVASASGKLGTNLSFSIGAGTIMF